MKFRHSVNSVATPSAVWPLVADPASHSQWNAKVVEVRRTARGIVALGERFEMTYILSDRESDSQVEVLELQPNETVAYRHVVSAGRGPQIVVERYDLQPLRDGVRIVQTIDMSRAGLPWWLRPLAWFLSRFGKPRGEDPLQRLAELAEAAGTNDR